MFKRTNVLISVPTTPPMPSSRPMSASDVSLPAPDAIYHQYQATITVTGSFDDGNVRQASIKWMKSTKSEARQSGEVHKMNKEIHGLHDEMAGFWKDIGSFIRLKMRRANCNSSFRFWIICHIIVAILGAYRFTFWKHWIRGIFERLQQWT